MQSRGLSRSLVGITQVSMQKVYTGSWRTARGLHMSSSKLTKMIKPSMMEREPDFTWHFPAVLRSARRMVLVAHEAIFRVIVHTASNKVLQGLGILSVSVSDTIFIGSNEGLKALMALPLISEVIAWAAPLQAAGVSGCVQDWEHTMSGNAGWEPIELWEVWMAPKLLEVSELRETNLSSRSSKSGSPGLRAPQKSHFFMELKTSGSSICSESSRSFEGSDSTCSTSM